MLLKLIAITSTLQFVLQVRQYLSVTESYGCHYSNTYSLCILYFQVITVLSESKSESGVRVRVRVFRVRVHVRVRVVKIRTRVRLEYIAGLEYYITARYSRKQQKDTQRPPATATATAKRQRKNGNGMVEIGHKYSVLISKTSMQQSKCRHCGA